MRRGLTGTAALALALTSTSVAHAGLQRTEVVAAAGSAQFKTVQQAVDAAPDGNVLIQIEPGEYREVVSIVAPGVILQGLGKRPEDVVLVYDNSAGTAGGTGKSATVTVSGDNFRAENLTIANDFEKRHGRTNEGSQAVALRVTGDREIFRHVRFLGYQDTLYADSKLCHTAADQDPCHAARQYYFDCYIEGHVDFIFGDAKAVFDHCEIHGMAHSLVTLTAQSRLRPSEDSGYLFLNSTVTADPGAQDILLGRPWRDYSTVIFLNTDFKAPLDPKAWMEWGGRLKTSTYAEYNSKGQAGDLTLRLAPARQLTAAEAATDTTQSWVAGPDHWNPETSP